MERIRVIDKIENLLGRPKLKVPVKADRQYDLDQNDNLSYSLAYLDKSYSKSTWRTTSGKSNADRTNFLSTDYKTGLASLVELIYNASSGNRENTFSHLIELTSLSMPADGEKDTAVLEYDATDLNNLHDVLLYSPRAIDNNYDKVLFIFYQLLQLTKYLHACNVNLGELNLSDIYIDQYYWIRVKLPIESILNYYVDAAQSESVAEPSQTAGKSANGRTIRMLESEAAQLEDSHGSMAFNCFHIKDHLKDRYDSFRHLRSKELANITRDWCQKKITNFDYLLILNCLAGKRIDCPYNHPIFPWISDFESFNTNLRDLTLSKFRISKGDAHLDLIYQASANNDLGSYHLTEFFSEITYFVYKSRVTDKDTLCKYVRRNWVPNEYPSSISRLYMWSPEECIPEFYCDPEIFKSIHDDLPDLKVPDWCNGSVDEFVRTHRLLLESDSVSKKLHSWIDLVFGYKLSGEAAFEAKNVCLSMIDNHQNMKTYGIVQLFTIPHPNRVIDKYYHSELAPRIVNRSRCRGDVQIDISALKGRYSALSSVPEPEISKKSLSRGSITGKLESFEILNSQIVLPDDYNPLALVEQMESILKFTNRVYHCLPDAAQKEATSSRTFQELAGRDLECLACLLVEMVLFNRLKCLPKMNPLSERYTFICRAIQQEPHLISGPFMSLILGVLKPFNLVKPGAKTAGADKQVVTSEFKKTKYPGSSYQYLENLQKYQNQFINIDTLLNHHLSVLPFKPYFDQYYKFSKIMHSIDYLVRNYARLPQDRLHFYLSRINTLTCLARQQLDFVPPYRASTDSVTTQVPSVHPQASQSQRTFSQRTGTNASTATFVESFTDFGDNQSRCSRDDLGPQLAATAGSVFLSSETTEEHYFRSQLSTASKIIDAMNEAPFSRELSSPARKNEPEEARENRSPVGDIIKLESLHEQKFFSASYLLPHLMINMNDPRKNQYIQSICFTNDSFELIIPYLLSLFQNPSTCINSFLFLLNKMAKFISPAELTKKVLPIVLHVLNAVDLNETMGLDLDVDEEKVKFCKLFDYSFINELRIIFGMQTFLVQIAPYLIEAISGFKDFAYDSEQMLSPQPPTSASKQEATAPKFRPQPSTPDASGSLGRHSVSFTASKLDNELVVEAEPPSTLPVTFQLDQDASEAQTPAKPAPPQSYSRYESLKSRQLSSLGRNQVCDQSSAIFDMENASSNAAELKALNESEDNEFLNSSSSTKSLNTSRDSTEPGSMCKNTVLSQHVAKLTISEETPVVVRRATGEEAETPAAGPSSVQLASPRIDPVKHVNISQTAFNTFCKLISLLGPVLTCKYFCTDLIKMLAICYMNLKCLAPIETSENPLHSIRPLEGDRFGFLLLESLKAVSSLYGEQVIVLQYITQVSNTVASCATRLTNRLESSLLAGIVLVNYFVRYLDIKLLLDYLNYILNQILIPVINIYSNEKTKFPSGFQMRQALAYKVLDVVLVLSLRIGPEQTRMEMKRVLKLYFGSFAFVASTKTGAGSGGAAPLKIGNLPMSFSPRASEGRSAESRRNNYSRGPFKARASIALASFSQHQSHHQRQLSNQKDAFIKENLSEEMNSFDDYYKFSFDQSTNELIGSSIRTALGGTHEDSDSESAQAKFRTQSLKLANVNDELTETSNRIEALAAAAADSSVPDDPKAVSIGRSAPGSPSSCDDQAYEEMVNTFSNELVHTAYMSVSRLNSGAYIDSIVSNADQIHQMCLKHEQTVRGSIHLSKSVGQSLSKMPRKSITTPNRDDSALMYPSSSYVSGVSMPMPAQTQTTYSSSYGSSFSENVGIVGNQITINTPNLQPPPATPVSTSGDRPSSWNALSSSSIGSKFVLRFSESELKESKANVDSSRHLNDNWLAYWENEIRNGYRPTNFDLKQINLLTLSGHSSGIKCICPLENEVSILSGSKDKTVKLWSLKNLSGITSSSSSKKSNLNCQWTYSQHKKAVFSVLFVESLRMCVSCDGNIHVWDPFSGRKVTQFDNQTVSCTAALPSPATSFVVATPENYIKFVDLRTKSFATEFRTCYVPSGSIKCITSNENSLLVGFSTGLMCMIDLRTGWIQESWKNHDNEILQLQFAKNDRFICTYSDGSISICSCKEKVQHLQMLKSYNEPVPFLSVTESQLITATSSNKIGIHNNIDKSGSQNQQVTFTLNKLQPDKFKGVLSSLTYLPLNRLLLLGSDSGDLKLFC